MFLCFFQFVGYIPYLHPCPLAPGWLFQRLWLKWSLRSDWSYLNSEHFTQWIGFTGTSKPETMDFSHDIFGAFRFQSSTVMALYQLYSKSQTDSATPPAVPGRSPMNWSHWVLGKPWVFTVKRKGVPCSKQLKKIKVLGGASHLDPLSIEQKQFCSTTYRTYPARFMTCRNE